MKGNDYIIKINEKLISTDGSIKYLFELDDKHLFFEAVYFTHIEQGETLTSICLSSQVGCSVGCIFCASGVTNFRCNLSSKVLIEVTEYILKDNNNDGKNVFIAIMGMGEPLFNLDSIIEYYSLSKEKCNVFAHSISTIVIPEKLRKLAESHANYDLYVSLHSASFSKRTKLIPISANFDLQDVLESCNYYYSKKLSSFGEKIKFSYLLLEGINSNKSDIDELIKLLKNNVVNDTYQVQLLMYNKNDGMLFNRVSDLHASEILNYICNSGIDAYLKPSKGTDILGGCGQLAGRKLKQ